MNTRLRTPFSLNTPELLDPLPGKLAGTVNVEFHTGEAVAMVNGRPLAGEGKLPKVSISGLKAFSRRTHRLMEACANDNPFATDCLVRIGQTLERVSRHMIAQSRVLQETAKSRLAAGADGQSRVSYEAATYSIDPVKGSLTLGIYASKALHCLVQFDELITVAKGFQYHLVITQPECRFVIQDGGRRLRHLLSLGQNWVFTLCTRKDLSDRNQVAQDAIGKLIERGFIDVSEYKDPEQIFDTFAGYDAIPLHVKQTEAEQK